jgi:hypothetical protein
MEPFAFLLGLCRQEHRLEEAQRNLEVAFNDLDASTGQVAARGRKSGVGRGISQGASFF